jgi:ubiquinone/menaquinone biosynthesis C-methylase UbiE
MGMDRSLHEIEKEAWSQRAQTYDALFASISTQAIRDILDSLGALEGKKHLDVACGTGHLVTAASDQGAISEGVDFAQAMVEAARRTYPRESFRVADARQLPHKDHSFDAVTCAFGLSHMEHPEVAISEVFRVLKPGGTFVFTLWFGPDDGNELQKIVKDALRAFASNAFTLPTEWTQLRFADQGACTALTRQAGFGVPIFKRLPIVWKTESLQAVEDLVDKLSIRTKIIIDHQLPTAQRNIYEYVRSEVESRRTDGIITLAWHALLSVVKKPQ